MSDEFDTLEEIADANRYGRSFGSPQSRSAKVLRHAQKYFRAVRRQWHPQITLAPAHCQRAFARSDHTAGHQGVRRMNELVTIAQYAERINAAWRQSVQDVIEAGSFWRRPRQSYRRTSQANDRAAFTVRAPHRAVSMEIALDQRLEIAKTISLLPADWSTIYEYSRIKNDEDFDRAVDEARQRQRSAKTRASTPNNSP